MTATKDIARLYEYEDEDIFDIVEKLERSFQIKFKQHAFYHVQTFGDFCDVVDKHINLQHRDDCTKQQAFYKLRAAIAAIQQIDTADIKPATKLAGIFPPHNRRQKIRAWKAYTGIDTRLLTYPDWLASVFVIGFLSSLAAFFFDWRVAIAGLAFFIAAATIADRLGKNLTVQTAGQLAEKIARENYIDARRVKGTGNRKEMLDIVVETFSNDLGIDKTYLTRHDKFSWAT